MLSASTNYDVNIYPGMARAAILILHVVQALSFNADL